MTSFLNFLAESPSLVKIHAIFPYLPLLIKSIALSNFLNSIKFITGPKISVFKIFPFKGSPSRIVGGLVQRDDDKILFIYRKNRWDLPKGGIEKNELIIEAAQREVKEETGLADIIVIDKIDETYHIFNNGKSYRLKRTYWYKMKSQYTGSLTPQQEEGITSVEWISKKRIPEVLENAYENIKGIVAKVI